MRGSPKDGDASRASTHMGDALLQRSEPPHSSARLVTVASRRRRLLSIWHGRARRGAEFHEKTGSGSEAARARLDAQSRRTRGLYCYGSMSRRKRMPKERRRTVHYTAFMLRDGTVTSAMPSAEASQLESSSAIEHSNRPRRRHHGARQFRDPILNNTARSMSVRDFWTSSQRTSTRAARFGRWCYLSLLGFARRFARCARQLARI